MKKIEEEIAESQLWSSLVDESSDITGAEQFITFVRYLKKEEICVRFLDIRRLDS